MRGFLHSSIDDVNGSRVRSRIDSTRRVCGDRGAESRTRWSEPRTHLINPDRVLRFRVGEILCANLSRPAAGEGDDPPGGERLRSCAKNETGAAAGPMSKGSQR